MRHLLCGHLALPRLAQLSGAQLARAMGWAPVESPCGGCCARAATPRTRSPWQTCPAHARRRLMVVRAARSYPGAATPRLMRPQRPWRSVEATWTPAVAALRQEQRAHGRRRRQPPAGHSANACGAPRTSTSRTTRTSAWTTRRRSSRVAEARSAPAWTGRSAAGWTCCRPGATRRPSCALRCRRSRPRQRRRRRRSRPSPSRRSPSRRSPRPGRTRARQRGRCCA